MEWFGEVWRRLLFLLRRRQFDRDIEEEMRLHRELAGARRFGNELLLREESRDSWGWRWLETLLADIRFALRLLRRNPAFTVVAILTLGLAIGANTLVFSLVNTVLLRPLPYADPESLYTLWTVEIQSQTGMNTSFPDFRDWQEQSHMFPAMSAFGQRSFNLTGAGNPERIDALEFTAGLPEVLGVGPVLGRPFRADDGKRVALLGHGLWMRHFAGDPAVLGRSIQLDGEPYTVVGVCPPSFHFPPKRFRGDPEVFVPLTPNMDRTAWGLKVVARLAPGATAAQAQSEMNAIGSRLVAAYPNARRAPAVVLTPIWEYVIEDSRKTARVLFGAVVFVLLIACANVANLLLSQGAARRREIAIRASIGASRRRIVRQLLVESALLGLCGGAVGILLAELGLPALAAVAPERTAFFTRIRDAGVHIDLTVLAFTAAVSLLAGMLFGILPAFKITRPSASLARRGASGRLRGVLIAAEVCLALILLAGAGLMMNSMVRLLSVDLGFRPERLLTMEVDLPRTKYANGEQQRAFFDKVLPRVASLSGVLSAGGVSDLPLTRSYSTGQIRVGGKMGRAAYHTATPGYFGTMGIPLVRGRLFAPTDTTQSPAVAIINRGLAERYWPHDDPIGKTVTVFGVRPVETPHGRKLIPMEEPLTVVGVVGDVRLIKLDGPPGAEVYRPYSQGETRGMAVVLRTAGNPESLAAAVRKEVWRADADQPITDVKSMQAVVATDVAERRFVLLLIGAFAAAAVALAAIGIFGVVSYVVRQRTQEIGIRMALGARRRNVAALVFRQTAVWVGAGIAGGIGGALALTRLLKAYLYGIQPVDAPTFALAVLALAGIAALANLVPARRAVKIDPIVALRYE